MHRTSDAQTTSTFEVAYRVLAEAAYRVLAEADGERTLVALLGGTAAGPPRVPLKPAVPEPLVEQLGAFREGRATRPSTHLNKPAHRRPRR